MGYRLADNHGHPERKQRNQQQAICARQRAVQRQKQREDGRSERQCIVAFELVEARRQRPEQQGDAQEQADIDDVAPESVPQADPRLA